MTPSSLDFWHDLFVSRTLIEVAASLVITLAVYVASRLAPATAANVRSAFVASLQTRERAVLFAALLPLAVRLIVLPTVPKPYPKIPDGFVHLLIADTLAQGRLANPPLPFREHFETVYVLQQPTYSGAYALGQGAFLASGKVLFGSFWSGVCLSVAFMAGAICWMLCAWLPTEWAFAGGSLAGLFLGVSGYWMNSYWGGAVSAAGGAILFGSLARFRISPASRYAVLASAGWALVFLTRPFEAGVLAAALGTIAVRRLKTVWACVRAANVPRTMFACAAVLFVAVSIQLSQNRTVTGNARLAPYQFLQKAQGVPQSLVFQPVVAEPPGLNRNQHLIYVWQTKNRIRTRQLTGYGASHSTSTSSGSFTSITLSPCRSWLGYGAHARPTCAGWSCCP